MRYMQRSTRGTEVAEDLAALNLPVGLPVFVREFWGKPFARFHSVGLTPTVSDPGPTVAGVAR